MKLKDNLFVPASMPAEDFELKLLRTCVKTLAGNVFFIVFALAAQSAVLAIMVPVIFFAGCIRMSRISINRLNEMGDTSRKRILVCLPLMGVMYALPALFEKRSELQHGYTKEFRLIAIVN
jgi:hypothetical protein